MTRRATQGENCPPGRNCGWPYQTFHICVDTTVPIPGEGIVKRRKTRNPEDTFATDPVRRWMREKRWDE